MLIWMLALADDFKNLRKKTQKGAKLGWFDR
jgi:hypothetical protein